jgi:hypothetical protein
MSTWFFLDDIFETSKFSKMEDNIASSRLDMKNLARLDEFWTTGLTDSMSIAGPSLGHSSSASMMIIVTGYKAAGYYIRSVASSILRIPDALPCYPSVMYS